MSTANSNSTTQKSSASKTKSPDLFELFHDGIQDIYWAESHLVKALPKMIKAASSATIKAAVENHLHETTGHVTRLESVFSKLGEKVKAKTCEAMKGILEEAEELLSETKEMKPAVVDVAILMASQKVEHYEIATYGNLIGIAKAMGETDIAALLTQTLNEETKASSLLTTIAETEVYKKAVTA